MQKNPLLSKKGISYLLSCGLFSLFSLNDIAISQEQKDQEDPFFMHRLKEKRKLIDQMTAIRESLHININFFLETLKSYLKDMHNSESSIEFAVDYLNFIRQPSQGSKIVIDDCCDFNLPNTKKVSNQLVRLLGDRNDPDGFLPYLLNRGFFPEKTEVEKYANKIQKYGNSIDDLLFIEEEYKIDITEKLPEFSERLISQPRIRGNNDQWAEFVEKQYHNGIIALKTLKERNRKLPNRLFWENASNNSTNFELDLGDIVLLHNLFEEPVNDMLGKRLKKLSHTPRTPNKVAEYIKIAVFMQKYNHPLYAFVQEIAVKESKTMSKYQSEYLTFFNIDIKCILMKSPYYYDYTKYAWSLFTEIGDKALADQFKR